MSRATGIIMVGAGILSAGASGLCSLGALAGQVMSGEPYSVREWSSTLGLILLFGGLPFAIGLALIIGGRREIRKSREGDAD